MNYLGPASQNTPSLNFDEGIVEALIYGKIHGNDKTIFKNIIIGEDLNAHVFEIDAEKSDSGIIDHSTEIFIIQYVDNDAEIYDHILNMSLDDIVGHQNAKLCLEDLFEQIRSHKKNVNIQESYPNISKAIHFFGPSGTGKTMILDIIRKECNSDLENNVRYEIYEGFDLIHTYLHNNTDILNDIYETAMDSSAEGHISLILIDNIEPSSLSVSKAAYSGFISSMIANINFYKNNNIITIMTSTKDDAGVLNQELSQACENIGISSPSESERKQIIIKENEKSKTLNFGKDDIDYIFNNTDRFTGKDINKLFSRLEREFRRGDDRTLENTDIIDTTISLFKQDNFQPEVISKKTY